MHTDRADEDVTIIVPTIDAGEEFRGTCQQRFAQHNIGTLD